MQQTYVDNKHLASQKRQSPIIIPTVISEAQKHIVRRVLRTQDPKRNDNNEEHSHVSDEADRLDLREDVGAPGVEEDGDDVEGQHDERQLPPRKGEGGHVHVDCGFDLQADDVDAAGYAC